MDEQYNPARETLLALLRGERNDAIPLERWQQVVLLAMRHGVSEWLYQQLTQQQDTIASTRLQELRKNYLLSAARNSFFYHELEIILTALHQEQIPVIVLKGAFLAEHIYPNIAARPMSDIDVLVLEKDLAHVDTLLQKLGFHRQFINLDRSEEEHALPYKNNQSGIVIEIHWVLVDAKHGTQVEMGQLWQRARFTSVATSPVLEMSVEDQILHLCLHASMHTFEMGLRALCDLDLTMRYYHENIDWFSLQQLAYEWKAERCVYIALRLTRELMHTPIEIDWLESLKPSEFEEHYYILAREHLFQSVEVTALALPNAAGVVRFWAARGWLTKLRILRQRVFPSREEMAKMYPAPANSWRIYFYYPARLFDLLQRLGKTGLSLVIGKKHTILRAKRQDEVNHLKDWLLRD